MNYTFFGLRPYTDSKTGKIRQREAHKKEVKDLQEFFLNTEEHLAELPDNERYNLFISFAKQANMKKSDFVGCQHICFDIDGVDHVRKEHYYTALSEILGVAFTEALWIHTGNGYHIAIRVDYEIEEDVFFKDKENKFYYKTICDKITARLKDLKLPGHADADYFKHTNSLRVPGSVNNKTEKTGHPNKNSIKKVKLLQAVMVEKHFLLHEVAGVEIVPDSHELKEKALANYGSPDSDYVVTTCEFLRFCFDKPEEVTQSQWYAAATIYTKLERGRERFHELSARSNRYNPGETDSILDRASAVGPRTKEGIMAIWNGCHGCPMFSKCHAPIGLKGPDHIATKDTGFRKMKETADGGMVPGKLEQDDLYKYFNKKYKYVTPVDRVFIWNDAHYEEVDKKFVKVFAEKNVKPAPSETERNEFLNKILVNNAVEEDFFRETTYKKMNLQNGVLDLSVDHNDLGSLPRLLPRSRKYGFTSVLPYSYDPEAQCPRFDQFMREITCDRQELIDVLLEFAGYAFSNMNCQHAKSLILLGHGSNGKSTFMKVLQALAGPGTYSAISLSKLNHEYYIDQLHGRLFNLTEETPRKAFDESNDFKNLVSGGTVIARPPYKEPFEFTNRAKFITACNEMPSTKDVSHGMLRRLIIVPFDADFKESENMDLDIDKKLHAELPGILNRVIEGYYRLLENGRFTTAESVEQEKAEFLLNNDPIGEFCARKLDINEEYGEEISIQQIFDEYKDYVEDTGQSFQDRMNIVHFSRNFYTKLPKKIVKSKRRRMYNNNRTYFIRGVRILTGDSPAEF